MLKLRLSRALLIAATVLVSLCHAASSGHAQRVARITPGSFTVAAGRARYYSFNISNRRGAQVTGRFRAEGGGGNDIQVFILDDDGLENFSNGHRTPTYYNSGRVTVARVNVRLAPGRYHLVFDNQ